MAESLGYWTMFGPGEGESSPSLAESTVPELVADPSFSGGWAFESSDPSTGELSRYAVDWGSLKTIEDFGTPCFYNIIPPIFLYLCQGPR